MPKFTILSRVDANGDEIEPTRAARAETSPLYSAHPRERGDPVLSSLTPALQDERWV